MKIHVLQHVPFEGAGQIARWAQTKAYPITYTRFYEEGWVLPSSDGIELLAVMGGPMGVHDEARYPWLVEEKHFIRRCIDARVRVLGVCLGAQLAASVLGAKVSAQSYQEIGWFPLQKCLPHPVLFDMAFDQMVFHWHGDTFELPSGALHLASSQACTNQIFLWNEQVLGLQCHMEMDISNIEALMQNCYQEASNEQQFVQSDEAIREGFHHADMLAPLFDSILTRFTS